MRYILSVSLVGTLFLTKYSSVQAQNPGVILHFPWSHLTSNPSVNPADPTFKIHPGLSRHLCHYTPVQVTSLPLLSFVLAPYLSPTSTTVCSLSVPGVIVYKKTVLSCLFPALYSPVPPMTHHVSSWSTVYTASPCLPLQTHFFHSPCWRLCCHHMSFLAALETCNKSVLNE